MADALLEKRNKLLRFFPVPRYLALGAVSCFIDYDMFRFIELVPRGSNMIIRKYGNVALPSAVTDDADEISPDIKKIVEKTIADKKIRSTTIVLPERLVYVFFITIPIVEQNFIHDALAFKLEEHIPIPPGDVMFEFNIMKRDERAKTMTIAVRAVPQKQVEKYIDFFTSLGVLVAGCETEGQSALLSALPLTDNLCRLVIKIGARGTLIFIAQGRSILFSSSISFGGGDILGLDKESLPILNSIKDEAKKIIEYWNSRPDADNTSQAESILLFGRVAEYSGVKEYFEAALSYPAEIANVWQNAFSLEKNIPTIEAKDATDMAPVIGLSLLQ
ncbi:MAG TPA: hypothetical protein VMR73_00860 [Candidatus Paceibacterota bacterium]|nr:hypothetical protein [Candidatus Paceibacterota bacterium]